MRIELEIWDDVSDDVLDDEDENSDDIDELEQQGMQCLDPLRAS